MGSAAPPRQSYDVRILYMLNVHNLTLNQDIIARADRFVNDFFDKNLLNF